MGGEFGMEIQKDSLFIDRIMNGLFINVHTCKIKSVCKQNISSLFVSVCSASLSVCPPAYLSV